MKNKIASFFNAIFVNHRNFGFVDKIEKVADRMNLSEKILFYFFSIVAAISGLVLLIQANNYFLVEVPSFGGSFTEGLVGNPRFINPVLAISDTDKDLTSLLYSGLLKASDNGGFELDLAEHYEVSEDGTIYDFFIKDSAYFHDGERVTTEDVAFTIEKVLDPVIKSPKGANWKGIAVEKINDREIRFILEKPYAPFLSVLTLGILPKHIWKDVSSEEFPFSQLNIDPIGSGPYKIKKITRNSGGIPTEITLSAWKKYASGQPKIKTIAFKFFQNEEALTKSLGESSVDSASNLSPSAAKQVEAVGNKILKVSLPRVFGVFFNQNETPVFLNKEVRGALNLAVPKKKIIDEVLLGFGRAINGPTPANEETDLSKINGDIEAAKSLLLANGWKEGESGILEKKTKSETIKLEFSIATSDAPDLKKTADILKEAWEKIGASVSVKVFESGDLSQNVIKTRKYEALLFGEVIGDDSDLYPFWHSSERNDPGLNVSMYTNITVDKMLEKIQKETNPEEKASQKEIVFNEIKNDVPAVFLFSPYYVYAPAPTVKNILTKNVSSQSERFLFVDEWFIETDKIWKFLVRN